MLAARRLEGELDQSVLQTGAAALGGVLTPPAVRVPVRPPRAHACHAARPSPMSPRPGVRGGAAQAVRELVGGADCREAPCAQRSPAAVALTTRHPPQPRARCRRVADELRATLAAREAEIGDLRRGIEQARRRTQFAASPQTFLIDKIEAAEGGAREAEARAAAAAQVRGVEGPIATLDGGVRAALGVCVGGGRPQGRARRGARAAEAPAGRPRAAAAAARLDRLAPHHARATSVRGKDTRGLDGWPVFLIQSEAEGHRIRRCGASSRPPSLSSYPSLLGRRRGEPVKRAQRVRSMRAVSEAARPRVRARGRPFTWVPFAVSS